MQQAFTPSKLMGLDADPQSLQCSQTEARDAGIDVQLISSDCAAIRLADASVDILFCHQTFHHLVEQKKALAEFYRVLKPG
ncbi:class I SAM-dependent methyltransferase, partial [Streptococcus suis]